MSDSELPGIILTGMPVCTKEDEDYVVGVVESVEGKSGNLIIRGNLDLRKYSVPIDAVVNLDQIGDRLVLDMTRDDFIEYEKQP
jgi:hypothetical protein